MSITRIELEITEGDTRPVCDWPITINGVQQDITAATKSAVLYYYEDNSDTALWIKTLDKSGTGATSLFEFVPDASHEYLPATAGSGDRMFYGDLFYKDTATGYEKWYRRILSVKASPAILGP